MRCDLSAQTRTKQNKCSLSVHIDPNNAAQNSMCSRDLFHDMFTCAKYFMAIYEHSRAAKYIYLSLRLQTVEDAAAREVVLGSNTGQI